MVSSNLPLICRSHRVLPFLLMYGRRGRKFIPLQQIYANSKGRLIIEGGVMSSEYGICCGVFTIIVFNCVM